MIQVDLEWMKNKEYLDFDEKAFEYKPKKDAPKEVLESYARYLKQIEAAEKRGAV